MTGAVRATLLLLGAVLVACASGRSPDAAQPAALPAPVSGAPTAGFRTPLDRDHPLVGRVWDPRAAAFVDPRAALSRVVASRLVVLGEQHDNADHHALQAELLSAVLASGRRPAVVAEMLDAGRQRAIDDAVRAAPRDADAVRRSAEWDHSGWPAWELYRPIFAVATGAACPLIAAGLPREDAMRAARGGVSAVPPELVERFALSAPLAPDVQAALRHEMSEAHCGMLPEEALDGMVFVQRVRDASLAAPLLNAPADGAVAIAGNGHARTDRGVPALVAQRSSVAVLSVAFVEVRHELTSPAGYAEAFDASSLPFDLVWFTPRATDDDHCAELVRRMRR